MSEITPNDLISVATLLGGSQRSEKLQKALAAYYAAQRAWELYDRFRHRNDGETAEYTVRIDDGDWSYDTVYDWLATRFSEDTRKALIAVTDRRYSEDTGKYTFEMRYRYDAQVSDTVVIDGHEITVSIGRDTKKAAADYDSVPEDGHTPTGAFGIKTSVTFICRDAVARDAVLHKLEEITRRDEDASERDPDFYVSTKHYWNPRGTADIRPMDTVILREGIKDRLIADVERFLARERQFVEWGIPWHRGYLFHGPPGTGKTSLSKALGSHFGLDVYYLAMSSVEDDATLLRLVGEIPERSLVVMEDIDIVRSTHTRTGEGENGGVTLQGVLNALDGFATPHGVIMVMTTNDRSVLDDALLRPGRVDLELEIDVVDDAQIFAMCDRFLDRRPQLPPVTGRVTPADVMNVFKDHMDDPDAAVGALVEYLKNGVHPA